MAKQIQPTPVLEGKDAIAFLKATMNPKYSKKKEKFLKECTRAYKQLMKKR